MMLFKTNLLKNNIKFIIHNSFFNKKEFSTTILLNSSFRKTNTFPKQENKNDPEFVASNLEETSSIGKKLVKFDSKEETQNTLQNTNAIESNSSIEDKFSLLYLYKIKKLLTWRANTVDTDSKKSSLILLIIKFTNKISSFIKIILKIIFILLILLKIVGLNNLYIIYSNKFYFKIACIFACLLVIFILVLELYLIHKFSKKNIEIPDPLPKILKE